MLAKLVTFLEQLAPQDRRWLLKKLEKRQTNFIGQLKKACASRELNDCHYPSCCEQLHSEPALITASILCVLQPKWQQSLLASHPQSKQIEHLLANPLPMETMKLVAQSSLTYLKQDFEAMLQVSHD